jgi:hypothetical protein
MNKLITIKNLFWIDGLAALISGTIVILCKNWFSLLSNLPSNLLENLAIIAFVFASFSITNAILNTDYKPVFSLLIIANLLYVLFCLILLIFYFKSINWYGISFLVFDLSVVSVLAFIEYRIVFVNK